MIADVLIVLGKLFLITYGALIFLFAAFFNNNLLFIRSKRKYQIPYGLKEGRQERKELKSPKVVYWKCYNPNQQNPDDWVIMLHSWGRNSGRMVERAKIHWELGFSLIFIDARSHGQSQFCWTSQGFIYGHDVIRVAQEESLKQPILHGLSVGAIAATVFAKYWHPRALIMEALVNNYRDMVIDTLTLFHLPKILFIWEVNLLFKLPLQFEEYRPDRVLPQLDCPIFLMHGEKDKWFKPENHFYPNLAALKGKNVMSWLVPNSPHSKMALHPNYHEKLREFITAQVKASPPISIKQTKQ